MTKQHTRLAGSPGAFIFAHQGIGFPRIALEAPNEKGFDAKDFTALSDAFKKATDDVKKLAETANTEVKNLGKMTAETKEAADKALLEMGETKKSLDARLSDLEQKSVRRGGPEAVEMKSLGQVVVENEEVKNRLLGNGGAKRGNVTVKVDTKAIISASGTWGATASVTNSLVVPDRQPLVPMQMRQLTIRDLVAPGRTEANAVEYAIQTARTNAAAAVAENTQKPYSNYTWDLRTFPVRTLAHMVKASRQILDDAPGLQSTIDAEMRYGLDVLEEAQFLNGDGTGQNVSGIIPQATAYSAAFTVTGATGIDVLRLAILQATLALYPVDAIVLNPTDWAKIEITKDGQGRYIVGSPTGQIGPRLWNQPVVSSIAMSAGAFLVGAFKYGAQVFDRSDVEVAISTENVDDFEKNMISIRCEERLAFVVKRPAAFITGSMP